MAITSSLSAHVFHYCIYSRIALSLSLSLLAPQVLTNIHGESEWEPCFVVPDVDLPTGYFLGMSAATGDLAGSPTSTPTHN